MSQFTYPNIVTNGLVFYYDSANNAKSWRGKPTTNTAANGKVDYYSRWAVTVNNPTLPFPKKTDVYALTLGNNYFGDASSYSITNGNTYTVSYWYYIETSQTMNHYAMPLTSSYSAAATASASTFIDTNNTRGISGNINGWVWGYKTFTVNAAPTYMRGTFTNGGDSDPTGVMYITNVMIESGSTPSGPYAYTGGTRSSTQAVLDLVGGNTITVNSLTYGNDGNFSFVNASQNYISFPYTQSSPNNFSVEAWIYPTAHSSDTNIGHTIVIPYGGYNAWIFSLRGGTSRLMLRHHNYNSSTTSYDVVNSTGLSLNTWYHVAATDSGTTVKLYVNGQETTSAASSISTTNGTMDCRIGSWPTSGTSFDGRISTVKIYNRALTAAEVQQNYNAYRGRYDTYVPLFLTTISGTLTVSRNGSGDMDIFKTSGSSAWDAQAYSTEPFTAPCTIEFNKSADSGDNGVSYAMIGWNTDPATDASYTSLDYAAYPFRTGGYEVYHNGTGALLQGSGVTWESGTKLYVVYDTDGYIRHYNGSKLLYSANYGTGNTVYVDSSFYSVNSTYGGFKNVKVIRKSWNGQRYV